MTISLSALETRLQNRLGFTSLSTLQSTQLREALNSAVSRVLTDGAPGLHRTFISCSLGEYTASDTVTMTAGNDYLDTDATEDFAAAGVLPGDILILNGTRNLLVHRIEPATPTRIYTGSRLDQTYAAVTLTIWRRSLRLPTSGAVTDVRYAGSNRKLIYDLHALSKAPFIRGSGQSFIQSNDAEGSGARFIALVPCPNEVSDFVITQAYDIERLTDDAENFELPDGVTDVVLARALATYRAWTSNDQIEQVTADKESMDADDQLREKDSARGLFVR